MNEPFPTRPTLIYDGDCSFCKRWIARWRNLTAGAIDFESSQHVAEKLPQIERAEFGKAVFFAEPGGRVTRAAEAVFRSLATAGQKRYLLWLYENVPPFRTAAEAAYGFIASNRNPIDRIDKIVVGTETRPATYRLTRGLVLRGLGLVYLVAFLSLWSQIDGLIGANGILPIRPFLNDVQLAYGSKAYSLVPTLMWLNPSDAFAHALCMTGVIAAALLVIGVLPMLSCAVLWACYLSLTIACQDFLSFQWDALLLEAGFLAIFFAPPLWLGSKMRPSRLLLFMIRWLLFRLMFWSALVKWFSGDESWRNMAALRHHFETQPLPTWTSWYAHHSPPWMLAIACAIMFVIEFIVPFLYFAPRRTRMFAFWLTVLLQINIMATGNYGFFNILAIVLAFSLLDDAAIATVTRGRLVFPLKPARFRPWLVTPLVAIVFVLTWIAGFQRFRWNVPRPAVIAPLLDFTDRLHLANGYGLFEVMTKTRPELAIEGSNDGVTWLEYEFKYKMGDVTRRPAFCIPHMPRLDWQMWFQALEDRGLYPWFQRFLLALLENKPDAVALLAKNPFPDKPPKYIRVIEYDYRFSDDASRKSTGAWWTRKAVRFRLAPVSLPSNDPTPTLRL